MKDDQNKKIWNIGLGTAFGATIALATAPFIAVPVAGALGIGAIAWASSAVVVGLIASGGLTGAVISNHIPEIPIKDMPDGFVTRDDSSYKSNKDKEVPSNAHDNLTHVVSRELQHSLKMEPDVSLLTTKPANHLSSSLAPTSSLSDDLLGSRIDDTKDSPISRLDPVTHSISINKDNSGEEEVLYTEVPEVREALKANNRVRFNITDTTDTTDTTPPSGNPKPAAPKLLQMAPNCPENTFC